MKRPQIHELKTEVFAKKVAEDIRESGWDTEDVDDNAAAITKILKGKRISSMDGFELGKEFDDVGFDVNMEFCEYLDTLSCEYRSWYEETVKKWVKHAQIKPEFKIGDEVAINRRGKTEIGEIIRVNEELAQYSVHIPLHHNSPTMGQVVNYEDVSKVVAEI